MYLHLGQNEIVADRQIIGIFDLDKCSSSLRTREYLAAAEREGVVPGGERHAGILTDGPLESGGIRRGCGLQISRKRRL